MSTKRNWEVFDIAHEHRLCVNENHGAEFGPMTKASALAMQASNPEVYWAREIPTGGPS